MMTLPVGTSLARVTVATPRRRVDVAVPDQALVAELLPHLLRHAGEELAAEGEAHGGWVLRRATGTLLAGTRTLTAQGVRDGEILQLAPARLDWPEPAYDDIVDVIAGGARRTGRSWGNAATRRGALAIGAAVLGLGPLVALRSGPAAAGIALGLAAALILAGVLLSRAFADATAGATVAASALPYALLGGALLGDRLLLGAAALLAASVLGYVGVAALRHLFMAGIATGVAGLLAGVLYLGGVSVAGAAAVTLTVALALLPGYPLIASGLGRLPVPQVPQRAEEILEDRPVPDRADVFAAVARATALLSGLLLAAAVVGTAAAAVLVHSGQSAALALAGAGAAALLLRGRLFPAPAQRIPLLASGCAVLVLVALAASWRVPLVALALVVSGAVAVLAGGLRYSRRAPSPYVGRIGDLLDVLAIIALVPLACAVLGVYQSIQSLFASFGG
jgi:type VII secretion integral membrane protein EccD